MGPSLSLLRSRLFVKVLDKSVKFLLPILAELTATANNNMHVTVHVKLSCTRKFYTEQVSGDVGSTRGALSRDVECGPDKGLYGAQYFENLETVICCR
jgi:hypothetical protein